MNITQKTLSPKFIRQILPAVYAGLFASLAWIVGDILLVGFTPTPEKYPLFSVTYANQVNVELATLMLSGSTNRLMWGALIAVLTTPFYLYSTFAVAQLIQRKYMMPVFLLLLIGISYSPLAHAGFFYVGEIYKAILHTDAAAHAQLLQTADGFMRILSITWFASIGLEMLGWIVFAIVLLRKKSLFKRKMLWLNPVLFGILIALIKNVFPSPLADYIGAAIFNEAHFLFFAILLTILLRKKKERTSKRERSQSSTEKA